MEKAAEKKPPTKEHSDCIVIPDGYEGYSQEFFCIPPHYVHDLKNVLIPKGLILDRTARLAQDICRELQAPLVALCVLKGGYQFFTDLLDFIKTYNSTAEHSFQMQVDFIRIESYVNDQSSGGVKVVGGDSLEKLQGKALQLLNIVLV